MDLDSADMTGRELRALGQALRRLRSRANVTQEELAARASTGNTYISRVENGRIDVGWTTLRRLLLALDASLGDLVAEVERQDPPSKR
jgi:transcriptional regulator with XRE-family HTH domain